MAPRAKKAAKPTATKPILAGCAIALAGSDLGQDGWKEGDVERWATAWGGAFSRDIDSDATTHVLATPEQFQDPKKKNARVQKAKKMKGLHIVKPDWLEDSITHKKRMPEKPYSLREAQRRENARKKRDERAERGIEKGKRLVNDCEFFCVVLFLYVTFSFRLSLSLSLSLHLSLFPFQLRSHLVFGGCGCAYFETRGP